MLERRITNLILLLVVCIPIYLTGTKSNFAISNSNFKNNFFFWTNGSKFVLETKFMGKRKKVNNYHALYDTYEFSTYAVNIPIIC